MYWIVLASGFCQQSKSKGQRNKRVKNIGRSMNKDNLSWVEKEVKRGLYVGAWLAQLVKHATCEIKK